MLAKSLNRPRAGTHYRWKPGGRIASNGYVKVRVGRLHPLSDPNGYTYEHLLIWVAAGNPRPGPGELLHHRNGEKTDNRIENLGLMKRGEHNAYHNRSKVRDALGRFVPSMALGETR